MVNKSSWVSTFEIINIFIIRQRFDILTGVITIISKQNVSNVALIFD